MMLSEGNRARSWNFTCYITNQENKKTNETGIGKGKYQWSTNKLIPVYHQRKFRGKFQTMSQLVKKEAYYLDIGQ